MDWNGQSLPPTNSITQALEKAERYWRGFTDYSGADDPHWLVQSATEREKLYCVRVSGRVAPYHNWWDKLDCNCEAGRKGLRVCWHKASAYLHYLDAQKECNYYGSR